MKSSSYPAAVPVLVKWNDETGEPLQAEGLTEIIGRSRALVYLPRNLPNAGSRVSLTINTGESNEIEVPATVVRVNRDAAHPQASLKLTKSLRIWKKTVWDAFKQLAY